MKRLFLVSLAIVLVMSLGIAMFPIQSVEAGQNGGRVFNITAKGQGDYRLRIWEGSTTYGTGEFSISVAGQAKSKQPLGHGYGYPPQAEVGGHISGSFDGHTIHAGLQMQSTLDHVVTFDGTYKSIIQGGPFYSPIKVNNLKLSGTFDGKVIDTAPNKIVAVYYDSVIQTNIIEVYLPNFPSPYDYLIILLYESGDKAADTFKVNIREVGN